ncbi:hypothetical protein D1872_300740 [compost metagenome]
MAIHLDISKEIKEPPKPNTAQNTNRPEMLDLLIPRTENRILSTTPSTSMTARLVTRNSIIRFILTPCEIWMHGSGQFTIDLIPHLLPIIDRLDECLLNVGPS